VEDLQAELDRLGQSRPSIGATLQQRLAILQSRVRRLAMAEAALKAGLDKDPEVAAAFERILAKKLRTERLEPLLEKVEISSLDVEAYYREHQEQFQRPAQMNGAWILMKVSRFADAQRQAEARQRAESAWKEASEAKLGDKRWEALAARISEDQATRYQGGDLGWTPEDAASSALPGPVFEALHGLTEAGQVAPLVKLEDGFAFVRLLGRKPAQPIPLEQVSQRIQARLLDERKQQVEEGFYTELLRSLGTELHPERLEELQPPAIEHPVENLPPPALPGP
jgi:parvulin-like peptidyl-prolyl isomerase